MNADQKILLYVGAATSGHGHFEVNSRNGAQLFYAGANVADNGLLRLSNRFGSPEVVGIAGDNNGFLELKDAQGTSLIGLDSDKAGNGGIWVFSKEGLPIWTSSAPQPTTSTSLSGDLDSDGDVDASDFLIFSENYGKK